MEAVHADEDLKGAALFGSERFPLMGSCMIFYIISSIHRELINLLLLQSPSEEQFCQNADDSETNNQIRCDLFHVYLC